MEKKIESRLRDGVKKLGGKAFKWVSPGNSGVADRLVLMPGNKSYIVELKKGGSKVLRPEQKIFKKFVESLGFRYYLLSSSEEVDSFLTAIKTSI